MPTLTQRYLFPFTSANAIRKDSRVRRARFIFIFFYIYFNFNYIYIYV